MSGSADPAAPRAGRLKKRRDFLRLAAKGKRAARPGLVLQAMKGEPGAVRLGFTVTRKVGNAVTRNRARRRLKEVARLTLPAEAAGWELVLIGRNDTPRRPFGRLAEDLRGALKQAGVLR